MEYDFADERTVDSMDVYWYEDGVNVKPPVSYKLSYWNGSNFVEVPNPSGYGLATNQFNTTKFDMVSTKKLRLEVVADGSSATGIEEWKVYDPRTVSGIQGPVSVHTPVGTRAQLPNVLTANTVDGGTKEVPITWAYIPDSQYVSPRQFTVEGTTAESDARVQATIMVDPVEGQVYVNGLTATKAVTTAGHAPDLPSTVKASYTDGSYKDVHVTWETVDADQYKLPGQFTVKGTAEQTDLTASVTVIVTLDPAKPNLALKAAASATHAQGGANMYKYINDGVEPTSSRATPNYNNWPNFGTETAELTWSIPVTVNKMDVYWFADGNTGGVKAPVSSKVEYWNGSAYVDVPNAVGNGLALNQYNTTTFDAVTTTKLRLTFSGTGKEATGMEEWKVYEANPVESVPTINVETAAKAAPILPATVTAHYMDGTTQELAVTWDELQPIQYAAAGTFTVFGTVQGTDLPAQAVITVTRDAAASGLLTGPTSVRSGKEFVLTLALQDVTGEVLAQDATVTFDTYRFEYEGVDQSLLNGNFELVGEKAAPGTVRLILANTGDRSATVNGDLLKLRFRAKDTAASGSANFAISQLSIANASGEETALAGSGVSIMVNAIDTSALRALIAEAQSVYDASVEGSEAGQYPAGTKADLQSAIDRAAAIAVASDSTQEQITQAITDLQAALQTFKDSVNHTRQGDMNGDSRVSIGDLAIVAAAYGKTAADSDWAIYAKSDLNSDGKIDIEDLAALARFLFKE
ncbi:Ig-like domain-containing protein [Paenibacillus hexagrammi]|uniref:Ig-like domain-containing protein n=1 Tax=Paenibacillus hexagrammi TaxID=2908839 RepID=A0ABY3SNI5_9BACL|nr:Ig-like domain-containing protein [Paenibacillus sp. YPD9-1]UJF35478.1 Ig-like domain-containing protein [Paenibacillus sp. YPD9-1]